MSKLQGQNLLSAPVTAAVCCSLLQSAAVCCSLLQALCTDMKLLMMLLGSAFKHALTSVTTTCLLIQE